MRTPEEFNRLGQQHLPAHLGIVITRSDPDLLQAELPVRAELMAPNGFLHAGSLVTLADTLAGYGCVRNLPDGASGFTTVELKSNHLGTVREGRWSAKRGRRTLGAPRRSGMQPSARAKQDARWHSSVARRCCCTQSNANSVGCR